jgi:tetratricopeptide (TPR) repeat protein
MLVVSSLAATAAAQPPTPELAREAQRHYRLGIESMRAESWEEAATEFKAAIAIDRLLALAHYNLGLSRMAQKRYVEAVGAYRDCRAAFEQLATLSERDREDRDRARRDEINDLKNDLARLHTVKSPSTERYRVRMEDRLRTLESMQSRDLNERIKVPGEVMLALGSAYFRQEKFADAEQQWKEAVAANNRLGEAHNNLAVLYMMTGRKTEAEQAVSNAERARFRVNPQLKDDIRTMEIRR